MLKISLITSVLIWLSVSKGASNPSPPSRNSHFRVVSSNLLIFNPVKSYQNLSSRVEQRDSFLVYRICNFTKRYMKVIQDHVSNCDKHCRISRRSCCPPQSPFDSYVLSLKARKGILLLLELVLFWFGDDDVRGRKWKMVADVIRHGALSDGLGPIDKV